MNNNYQEVPRFRNVLILKGISIQHLSIVAGVPQEELTKACKNQAIAHAYQLRIIWCLQLKYGIRIERSDLFYNMLI